MRGLTATALFAVSLAAYAAEPEIRLVEKDGKPVAFAVTGLPAARVAALEKIGAGNEAASRTLAVYVGKTASAGQPPIAGSYAVQGGGLRFTPSFPLKGGLTYRAVLSLPAADGESAPARYEKVFSLPAPRRGEPAKVTAVYPTAGVLPENQLRFYLHFSAPMSRGQAYEQVRLLHEDGQPVEMPFLEVGEELWDASGRRLTLLFDPGRVKRGLKPREDKGPVLEAGRKYTLVVSKDWQDASGQPLAAEFRKAITAGPSIEMAIDQRAWKITPPPTGTRQSVIVRFDRSLDHALLQRTITVEAATGTQVAGEVTVGREERSWEFRPDEIWVEGKFNLVVDTTLEDTAGNRIGRPFEVDQFQQIDKQPAPEVVRLPFEIRPAGR